MNITNGAYYEEGRVFPNSQWAGGPGGSGRREDLGWDWRYRLSARRSTSARTGKAMREGVIVVVVGFEHYRIGVYVLVGRRPKSSSSDWETEYDRESCYVYVPRIDILVYDSDFTDQSAAVYQSTCMKVTTRTRIPNQLVGLFGGKRGGCGFGLRVR
jgi:hypothetical protein